MPRKPGKPTRAKIGRPSRADNVYLQTISAAKMREYKEAILRLFDEGRASTISQAAELLGLHKTRVWSWVKHDPEFQDLMALAYRILGDKLIEELREEKNFIAKIFLLKRYHPEFRENYKILEIRDNKVENLLEEFRRLGRVTVSTVPPVPQTPPAPPVIEGVFTETIPPADLPRDRSLQPRR